MSCSLRAATNKKIIKKKPPEGNISLALRDSFPPFTWSLAYRRDNDQTFGSLWTRWKVGGKDRKTTLDTRVHLRPRLMTNLSHTDPKVSRKITWSLVFSRRWSFWKMSERSSVRQSFSNNNLLSFDWRTGHLPRKHQ